MALQGTYNETVVKGDTFSGGTVTITDGGSPVDLTGATITWDIRSHHSNQSALEKTVGDGLVLSTPASGEFTISQITTFPLPEGTYRQFFRVTLASGERRSYVKGDFTVTKENAK